ncbi:MAG: hypothetical protein M9897_08820 [Brumimicrobium sp.]|nr:hypothetical protein [Brumimicrobium sp.]
MATKTLNKIFLSASIPYQERDRRFYDTADIVAIRDSVRALATVVIPNAHLIWGGHPAITPLIRYVMERMNTNLKDHITLYQSKFFKTHFPEDNFHFENIQLTKALDDRDNSLKKMRYEMIAQNEYKIGIFIGGMEGVLEEYELFKNSNPNALILPVASTGAAAKIIYDSLEQGTNERLTYDYAYMALFSDLLSEHL